VGIGMFSLLLGLDKRLGDGMGLLAAGVLHGGRKILRRRDPGQESGGEGDAELHINRC